MDARSVKVTESGAEGLSTAVSNGSGVRIQQRWLVGHLCLSTLIVFDVR